ncbi:hypothetical protein ATO49_05325 [Mycolicibacterium fortuitum subsp. fortuitum DSM 46621 = ATCC 6841 = JCM 6387]|nr:hypothetical protein ATO49_05325 [Mycolicibacterium fortuitum subsp. fortuitum DSM 46621 = ATCC 6841 = JCM 6387]
MLFPSGSAESAKLGQCAASLSGRRFEWTHAAVGTAAARGAVVDTGPAAGLVAGCVTPVIAEDASGLGVPGTGAFWHAVRPATMAPAVRTIETARVSFNCSPAIGQYP